MSRPYVPAPAERRATPREEIRLECLRLALARSGANDPRPWRTIAEELFGWVTGQAPAARGLAPPPGPA